MIRDYNEVVGISIEEFRAQAACLVGEVDEERFVRSDEGDIRRMERLLDVREGTLDGDEYWIARHECTCGRTLTMYDFVFTGLVDARHSKSLILHTFLGSKLVLNERRSVRCSQCARLIENVEY